MKLTEKMIEDAFCRWIPTKNIHILKRQVRLPFGRIDVLCMGEHPVRPYVVEVKRGKAPQSAFTQLLGYTYFLQHAILNSLTGLDWLQRYDWLGKPTPILVAETFDAMTMRAWREGNACELVAYRHDGQAIAFEFLNTKDWPGEMNDKPSWFSEMTQLLAAEYAEHAEHRMLDTADDRHGGMASAPANRDLAETVTYWRKEA